MRDCLYMLGQLDDKDLEWMISVGRRHDIPPGTVLIHEGVETDALYIVLDGAVSVSLASLGGKEFDRKLAGEYVGEMSFVDARPASATVRAAQPTTIFVIDRFQLQAKLEQDSAFAARFYRSLAIFLSNRLRDVLGRLGPGQGHAPDGSAPDGDELDLDVLDKVDLAGARFSRMLQRLRES